MSGCCGFFFRFDNSKSGAVFHFDEFVGDLVIESGQVVAGFAEVFLCHCHQRIFSLAREAICDKENIRKQIQCGSHGGHLDWRVIAQVSVQGGNQEKLFKKLSKKIENEDLPVHG